jgi:hypothetical protein
MQLLREVFMAFNAQQVQDWTKKREKTSPVRVGVIGYRCSHREQNPQQGFSASKVKPSCGDVLESIENAASS